MKTGAVKKATRREIWLSKAKVAGYHNDSASLTRLRIEARVRPELLMEAWRKGVSAKSAGVPCDCYRCTPSTKGAA